MCLNSVSGFESGTMGKKGPNPKVYFDITIGGDPVGKVVMEVCIHISYHPTCFLYANGFFVTAQRYGSVDGSFSVGRFCSVL